MNNSKDKQTKFEGEDANNRENMLSFVDSYGNTLLYTGNNEYTFFDTQNKSYTNDGKVNYNPSLLEVTQKQFQNRIERYNKLKELRSPEIILNDAKKKIYASRDEISKISGEDKITLEDIELITSECTESDIEEMLEVLLDMEVESQNIFEKGVGYGEH